MDFRWDAGTDWLEDYTYYAEIVGSSVSSEDFGEPDWWHVGTGGIAHGDHHVPQPKVFRAYAKSTWTMVQFVECVSLLQAFVSISVRDFVL